LNFSVSLIFRTRWSQQADFQGSDFPCQLVIEATPTKEVLLIVVLKALLGCSRETVIDHEKRNRNEVIA